MHAPIAYLRDRFLSFEKAALPVWDAGIVQGATVTDMVRTYKQELFQLDEHIQRFQNSCAELHLELPDRFEHLVRETLRRNHEWLTRYGELGILFFATPGDHALYTLESLRQPTAKTTGATLCLHPFRLPWERFDQGYRQGIALAVPAIRQIPSSSIPPRIKYRSRLHWYLAEQQARSIDPAASALLLDQQGYVTETNSGNLFVVRQGKLFTPRAETTLSGITQRTVMRLSSELGLTVERADLTPDEVQSADEAFLTSTTYGLMPVTRFHGQPLGSGKPGPLCRQLQSAFSNLVGVDIRQQAAERTEPQP